MKLTDNTRAKTVGSLRRQIVSADANPSAVGQLTTAGVHSATSRIAIFSTCSYLAV